MSIQIERVSLSIILTRVIQQCLVIKVTANLEIRCRHLRIVATRGIAASTTLMSLTATFFMSIELALVHLMDTFDFLQCYGALAERTTRINNQPLLNALSVEVVTDVAR